MIGVFDSGLGGLTILRALAERFDEQSFVYLGDHANVPYGDKPSGEILALTRAGVERLFGLGCRLVILGCNTATAIAARELQQRWLPASAYREHNLLGIVAPTVELATQTPWTVTSPQYPQKYNDDTILVFATSLTVRSRVYIEEIAKRCPHVTVHQQACPGLASAIEEGASESDLSELVRGFCASGLEALGGQPPHHAILGCTHFPIVEELFAAHLPSATRIRSQPAAVADSLHDYLSRHPHYVRADATGDAFRGTISPGNVFAGQASPGRIHLLTTGRAQEVTRRAHALWPDVGQFAGL